MLHPALARALASAHIDDLHRAAARWHTIRLARGTRGGHFNRHTAIRLRVSGVDFVRPGRGHDANRDCSSSPMAMPIRRRRPLGAASRNRSGIEIVMSPLPMLRLNTRIGGSDSTPTTAFAGPRRCRFRTKGVTTPALARRARAGTNAGLATVDDVCLATRQVRVGQPPREIAMHSQDCGLLACGEGTRRA
jgi:hypothetical protein